MTGCGGNIWFVDSVCMQRMLVLLTWIHTCCKGRRLIRERNISVLRFHKCCSYPSSQLICYTLTKWTSIISCSNQLYSCHTVIRRFRFGRRRANINKLWKSLLMFNKRFNNSYVGPVDRSTLNLLNCLNLLSFCLTFCL